MASSGTKGQFPVTSRIYKNHALDSTAWDRFVPRDLLVKDVPPDKADDLDYIVDMVQWDLNVDPDFVRNRFLRPEPVKPVDEMRDEGYEKYVIACNPDAYFAKELTVLPGRSIEVCEDAAYGVIVVEGYGMFGVHAISAPIKMIKAE